VLQRLIVQNFLAVPAPLFRRELALQAGGMDESLWYAADWDLWLNLSPEARSCTIRTVPSIMPARARPRATAAAVTPCAASAAARASPPLADSRGGS